MGGGRFRLARSAFQLRQGLLFPVPIGERGGLRPATRERDAQRHRRPFAHLALNLKVPPHSGDNGFRIPQAIPASAARLITIASSIKEPKNLGQFLRCHPMTRILKNYSYVIFINQLWANSQSFFFTVCHSPYCIAN